MPQKRSNRNRKNKSHPTTSQHPQGGNNQSNNTSNSSQSSNNDTTGKPSNKKTTKKLKKMDLRGPHWKANLDYCQTTPTEKKKNFPVIKGTQAFDLQHEYQSCYKKFMGNYGQLNELTEILKTPLESLDSRKNLSVESNGLTIIHDNNTSLTNTNSTTSTTRKNLDDAKFLSVDEKLNLLNLFIAKIEPEKVSSLPKMLNKLGYSSLHHICENENNDPEMLEWFLETFSSIDIHIDTQNRFLQTPLHLAIINGLAHHVKILIMHNADPRIVTVDGYNGVDLAKLHLPKEMDLVQNESLNSKVGSCNRMDILNLVESGVNDIEELERDTNNLSLEFSEVPTYPEKVQKYLLVNGNNMQVDNIDAFTRHIEGDMSKIQEAHDKRIIVKIQKPTLGEGMCLVSNSDKSYYSFIMPDHVMYKKLTSMIEELTEKGMKAYFYATPFDEWHLVLHDIFSPQQSW